MRLPGGAELQAPVGRRPAARARDRPRARAPGGGRPARRRRRPGGARRRRVRRLRGPRHARRRGHRARRPGGLVEPDRELPRVPGGDQRRRAHEPSRVPGAEVRRAARRRPTAPSGSSPATGATSCSSRRSTRSPRARSSSPPAPSTGGCRSTDLSDYEGTSVFYAAGPPEAQLCGAARVAVVGGGNSAGPGRGLARPRRRARHAPAPPRRPARDDVGLPHPRARALRRRGARPQRDRRAARTRRATRRR